LFSCEEGYFGLAVIVSIHPLLGSGAKPLLSRSDYISDDYISEAHCRPFGE
jgi:hypothetical protein